MSKIDYNDLLNKTALLMNNQCYHYDTKSKMFENLNSINELLLQSTIDNYSIIKEYILDKAENKTAYIRDDYASLKEDIELTFDMPETISHIIVSKIIKNPNVDLTQEQIKEIYCIDKALNLINRKLNEDICSEFHAPLYVIKPAKLSIADYDFNNHNLDIGIFIEENGGKKISINLNQPNSFENLIQEINNQAVQILFSKYIEEDFDLYSNEYDKFRTFLETNGDLHLNISTDMPQSNFIHNNITAQLLAPIFSHEIFNNENLSSEELSNRLQNVVDTLEFEFYTEDESYVSYSHFDIAFYIDGDKYTDFKIDIEEVKNASKLRDALDNIYEKMNNKIHIKNNM